MRTWTWGVRRHVMRRTLAGTLDYLLRQSADVSLAETRRPAEADVDLIAFLFTHRTSLLRALRVYEQDRRQVTL